MASQTLPVTAVAPSRFRGGVYRIVTKYRHDHTHPVNKFLHFFMGWPMVAAAILLLPFKPVWSIFLAVGGYAAMFFGHFVFEKNVPTILKHPSVPFVMCWAILSGLWTREVRKARNERTAGEGEKPTAMSE